MEFSLGETGLLGHWFIVTDMGLRAQEYCKRGGTAPTSDGGRSVKHTGNKVIKEAVAAAKPGGNVVFDDVKVKSRRSGMGNRN